MMMMMVVVMIIIILKLQYNNVGIRLKPKTMMIICCGVGITGNVTQTLCYLRTVYLTLVSVFRKM
jgi:hypothetical protein